ncbi:MAG TPA: hypothetical protein VF974_07765 [Patescibacteria group bacterium]
MKKMLLLVLACSISALLLGQRYSTDGIIKKADSLLTASVGKDIFKAYFLLDSTSYFETKTIFHQAKIKYLTKTKRTNGKLHVISVRYNFYLALFNPHVTTSVVFDQYLHLQQPIETSYIPQFIWNRKENNFLVETDVLQMAKAKFVKKGIKPLDAALTYDSYRKLYLWTVTNIISEYKGYNDEISREVEFLEIDAINGKVLNYYPDALQGHIH